MVIALLSKPNILFLDEVTTGLDVSARREVYHVLKQLKQQGVTIYLKKHYMEEAEMLCDRIMTIQQGREVVMGSRKQILSNRPYEHLD